MESEAFGGAVPARVIWVSADGDDQNSGAQDAPIRSIQLAIDRATPGTAILLKPGEYSGNFEFQNIEGTPDKPIWIAAAEGPGTAIITAATNAKAVITIQGEDNIVIRDLVIKGGANGIQVSQSGNNYTDLVNNIRIEGNKIVDAVGDGIKVSQAVGAYVVNNVVDGAGGEGIDFVGVRESEISGNEISNVTGPSAGLFVKAGSSDILIANNYVHDVAGDGILVGGWSSAGGLLPGTDYEAKNVTVVGNSVEDAAKRALGVLGAEDVDIHDNFFGSVETNDYVVYVGAGSPELSPPPISSNISIHDNVFDRSYRFAKVESGSTGVVFADNVKDGVIEGDMRVAPPGASDALVDIWPDAILDAMVWPTTARWTHTVNGTSGADNLAGTTANDFMKGGSNTDTMAGGRGDDTYEITTWRDAIVENAGEGADQAQVWSSSYTLAANVENLIVRTGGGGTFAGNALNNIFVGGSGNDVMTGGAGHDLFVFGPGRGRDTITDFAAGSASRDTIDLSAFTGLKTFDDVLARATQSGANTVITFATGESLTLSNVARSALVADDFLLTWTPPAEPVNQSPTGLALSASSIGEDSAAGTVVGVLSATDPDTDDTFTYALTDDAGGAFTLDGDKLIVAQPLDHESASTRSVTVRVTDSAGNVYEQQFTIVVDNVAPSAPVDTNDTDSVVAEGAANGTGVGITAAAVDANGGAVTYSLIDDAGGRFAIDTQTGEVTVANGALLDHETTAAHTIVVRASDGKLASATTAFTIAVGNIAPSRPVDRHGAVNIVAEDAANGAALGIIASAADINGGAVTYSLVDNAGGRFAIDALTGEVTVANAALLDYETAAEHTIIVRASDGESASAATAFTIAVGNVAPSAPVDRNGAANTVSENAENGTSVGIAASAADVNGGTVAYSLVDNAGGRFAIDALTGEVTVANAALLDYESASEHTIIVLASDGRLASAATAFTIAVTDADEGTIETIRSATSYVLGPYLENLKLTGSSAASGVGNALDNIIWGNAGSNTLAGGGGRDTASYDQSTGGVRVNLNTTKVQKTGAAGNDKLTGFENLTGSNFNDGLTGNPHGNVLTGLKGSDILDGHAGNDWLLGGISNDTLTGGAGRDVFVFQSLSHGRDKVVDFASGVDSLQVSASGFDGGLDAGKTARLVRTSSAEDAFRAGPDGYFIFDNAGKDAGTVYWDRTGGDGHDAVAFATLHSGAQLSVSDLVIVA